MKIKKDEFKSLFVDSTHCRKVEFSDVPKSGGSRIGGGRPIVFEEDKIVCGVCSSGMKYLLTFEGSDFNAIFSSEKSVSIFYCPSFECRLNNNNDSSQLALIAKIHDPSFALESSDADELNVKALQFGEIISNIDEVIEEDGERIEILIGECKVGGKPAMVQNSRESNKLKSEGYGMFFQLNEEYLPSGIFKGDYVFGFGTMYVFGKVADDIIETSDMKLFWQN